MFDRKGAMEALKEANIDFKGNASNEELQRLILDNGLDLKEDASEEVIKEVEKENKIASKVTLEDVYVLLNDRLPSKNALLSIMPKKKDQAITALRNIIDSIEGDSKNIEVAKSKMKSAINLLKLED